MKRPRPTPPFFADSDSDSDAPTVRPSSRFKPSDPSPSNPPPSSSPPTPYHNASVDPQPDSLDAFMSTLQPPTMSVRPPSPIKPPSPQPLPAHHITQPLRSHSPSSSSSPTHPSSPASAVTARQNDLTLPPVDYSTIPTPPVVAVVSVHWPEPASSSQLLTHGISLRNAHSTVLLSRFDLASPALSSSLLATLPPTIVSPTPIQSAAIPVLLSGRDVLAVAPTGSGKTLAYGLPLLAHAHHQPPVARSMRGPVALILAPTRELVEQIASVLSVHSSTTAVVPVVGGVDKMWQVRRIRAAGVTTLVATPGRLIDVLRMRAVRLARVSFVVLDEADRMLDLGFGPQVRTVMSQIRPDAQHALFSATMPSFVDRLATSLLTNPVHISISTPSTPSSKSCPEDVSSSFPTQTDSSGSQVPPLHGSQRDRRRSRVEVGKQQSQTRPAVVAPGVVESFLAFDDEHERHAWLLDNLAGLVRRGQVIVFCSTRGDAAALSNAVRQHGTPAACVHGETAHDDRVGLLRLFRSAELPVLITTDVSARGLDIDNVAVVVNYACAKSWEWHVHRVGRTGRADKSGYAYTLMNKANKNDTAFAAEAADVLRKCGREVPEIVGELAAIGRRNKEESRGRGSRNRRYRAGRRG